MDKDFIFKITVILTIEILTPKLIAIIYRPSPLMIEINVNLGETSVKVMSGQDFANAGQAGGRTDRRTYRQTYRRTTSAIT